MTALRYFATAGPIQYRDATHALGVILDSIKNRMPDGMAFPIGWIADDRGPITTFQLTIVKEDLPTLQVCLGREFITTEAMTSNEKERGAVESRHKLEM